MLSPALSTSDALFAGLTPQQIEELTPLFQQRSYPENVTIISENEPADAVYLIQKGYVKVWISGMNGNIVILSVLGKDNFFGELGILEKRIYANSVTTLKKTELLCIPMDDFQRYLDIYSHIGINLARIIARRLQATNAQLLSFTIDPIERRLARTLCLLAEAYGQPNPDQSILLDLHLTQSDLAAMIGATRGRTNEALQSFRADGLIDSCGRGRLLLRAVKALAQRGLG